MKEGWSYINFGFFNLIFQLQSARARPAMEARVSTTVWNMRTGILLPCDYTERIRVYVVQSIFQKKGAPFFVQNMGGPF